MFKGHGMIPQIELPSGLQGTRERGSIRYSPDPPAYVPPVRNGYHAHQLSTQSFEDALGAAVVAFVDSCDTSAPREEFKRRLLALGDEMSGFLLVARKGKFACLAERREALYAQCRDADIRIQDLIGQQMQLNARINALNESVSGWQGKVSNAKAAPISRSSFPTREELAEHSSRVEAALAELRIWVDRQSEAHLEADVLAETLRKARIDFNNLKAQLEELDGHIAGLPVST